MHAPDRARRWIRWNLPRAGMAALFAACQPPVRLPTAAPAPANGPAAEAGAGTLAVQGSAEPPVDCLTSEELTQISLAERARLTTLCYRSADGVETVIDQARHIAGIRAFLGDPERVMGFREISFTPNSPDGRLRTALYEDERGLLYYYAVTADKVVEMSPAAYAPAVGQETLPESELRAMAEALIRRELPEFETLREQLTSSGGEKSGGLYFFRWEARPIAGEGSMPPLAQVGITASGEIFSYINTLDYLK